MRKSAIREKWGNLQEKKHDDDIFPNENGLFKKGGIKGKSADEKRGKYGAEQAEQALPPVFGQQEKKRKRQSHQ